LLTRNSKQPITGAKATPCTAMDDGSKRESARAPPEDRRDRNRSFGVSVVVGAGNLAPRREKRSRAGGFAVSIRRPLSSGWPRRCRYGLKLHVAFYSVRDDDNRPGMSDTVSAVHRQRLKVVKKVPRQQRCLGWVSLYTYAGADRLFKPVLAN